MIQRDIKETLDLCRMQVDGHHTGNPCALQNICHQFGRNGFTPPGLTVLPGITIKGDHRNDMIGGSTFEGVGHNQQLHYVVIDDGSACGLDNKNIFAANAFIDHGLYFAVVKTVDDRIAQRGSQIGCDLTCQVRICVACKNPEFIFICQHLDFLPCIPCTAKQSICKTPY